MTTTTSDVNDDVNDDDDDDDDEEWWWMAIHSVFIDNNIFEKKTTRKSEIAYQHKS